MILMVDPHLNPLYWFYCLISWWRSICYTDRYHDFPITILRCYKDAYIDSFFPHTTRLWTSLLIEWFLLTYHLKGCKSRINRQTKAKKFIFFEKKHTYCPSVTWHVLLNRSSSHHQYIIKLKMKEFFFILLSLCIFICNYFYIYWYRHKLNKV